MDAHVIDTYKAIAIVEKNYKNLVALNYEAESNGIDNLIADLNSSTYAPHVATLNLAEFIDRIKVANDEFKLKFSQRSTDISSTEHYNMKAIRKATIENYNNYTQYVLSLAKVPTGDDYYKNILNIINQTRKYFSDMFAKRKGGNNNPPAGGTPS